MKRSLLALFVVVTVLTACGGGGKNESKAAESSASETLITDAKAEPKEVAIETTEEAKKPAETEPVATDKTPEDLAAKIAESIDAFQDDMEQTMKSYGMDYNRYDYEISTNGDDIVVNMYSGSLKNAIAAANGDDFFKQGWESTQRLAEMDAKSYQDMKLQFNLPDSHITLNIFDKEDDTALMISYLDDSCTFDISKQSGFEDKASTVQQDTYRKKLEEGLEKIVPGLYEVDYKDDVVEIVINGEGTASIALGVKSDAKSKASWGKIEMLVSSIQSLADILQTDAGNQKKSVVIKLIDPSYSETPLIEYKDGKCIFDLGA